MIRLHLNNRKMDLIDIFEQMSGRMKNDETTTTKSMPSLDNLGLMLAVPGPTLLDLQRSINEKNDFNMGFVFTARSIGYLIGSLSGGVLLDYLRYEEIALVFSNLFLAFGAFFIPWCREFWLLMVTFGVVGFTMGFSNTGSNTCCLSIWGKKGAPVIQGLHFCFGLGGLLAPLLATAFLPSDTVIPDHTLLSLSQNRSAEFPIVAAGISSNFSTDVELRLAESGAILIDSILYTYSTIGSFTICVVASFIVVIMLSSNEKSEKENLKNINTRKPGLFFTTIVVSMAALQVGLISSVEITFSQLLTSYVVKGPHKSSIATGYILTSNYWGTFTLARAVTIAASMKVRSVYLLIMDFVITMSGILILLIMGESSITALWAGTCIVGFGVASFFPGTLSWIEKYINMNNRVVSAFTVVASIFEMIAPMTVNFYLESQPNILFYYMLGATITSLAVFVLLRTLLFRIGEKYDLEFHTFTFKVQETAF